MSSRLFQSLSTGQIPNDESNCKNLSKELKSDGTHLTYSVVIDGIGILKKKQNNLGAFSLNDNKSLTQQNTSTRN